MSSYIPEKLRKAVAKRANFRCEYCQMPQLKIQLKHEPDHILPRKHDGKTSLENLAFACFSCNRNFLIHERKSGQRIFYSKTQKLFRSPPKPE